MRQLERELGTVLRKTRDRSGLGAVRPAPIVVDAAAVREALGRPKVFQEAAIRTAVPGVATGLAVTGAGGDVLFVEAASMPGKGGLVLTGQLGDVMKESARIALTYVKSHATGAGHRCPMRSTAAKCTSTCRPARSRRTDRAPA